jgi:hypothetical protein
MAWGVNAMRNIGLATVFCLFLLGGCKTKAVHVWTIDIVGMDGSGEKQLLTIIEESSTASIVKVPVETEDGRSADSLNIQHLGSISYLACTSIFSIKHTRYSRSGDIVFSKTRLVEVREAFNLKLDGFELIFEHSCGRQYGGVPETAVGPRE